MNTNEKPYVYNNELNIRQFKVLTELHNVLKHNIILPRDNNKLYGETFDNLNKIIMPKIGYKISSLWYTDGIINGYNDGENEDYFAKRAYMIFELKNSNYDTYEVTSANYCKNKITLNSNQLNAILDELEKLTNKVIQLIEVAKKQPSTDELIDRFMNYVNTHIDNVHYKAEIESGKLNYESCEPYESIVIREKNTNNYISSLLFGMNDFGDYGITIRVPLAGTTTIKFSLNKMEETIKDVLDGMNVI